MRMFTIEIESNISYERFKLTGESDDPMTGPIYLRHHECYWKGSGGGTWIQLPFYAQQKIMIEHRKDIVEAIQDQREEDK